MTSPATYEPFLTSRIASLRLVRGVFRTAPKPIPFPTLIIRLRSFLDSLSRPSILKGPTKNTSTIRYNETLIHIYHSEYRKWGIDNSAIKGQSTFGFNSGPDKHNGSRTFYQASQRNPTLSQWNVGVKTLRSWRELSEQRTATPKLRAALLFSGGRTARRLDGQTRSPGFRNDTPRSAAGFSDSSASEQIKYAIPQRHLITAGTGKMRAAGATLAIQPMSFLVTPSQLIAATPNLTPYEMPSPSKAAIETFGEKFFSENRMPRSNNPGALSQYSLKRKFPTGDRISIRRSGDQPAQFTFAPTVVIKGSNDNPELERDLQAALQRHAHEIANLVHQEMTKRARAYF